MSNNLPIKAEKNNIFKKIILFFKKIFVKEQVVIQPNKKIFAESENKLNEQYKVEDIEFISKVAKRENKKIKLEEIIQIIEKEPQTLEKLELEKLQIIDQYYIDKIAEYNEKLTNMS